MARPLRLEFKGAVYHLTSRGNARQKIFFSDADRELFIETLTHVISRYGWICHAYCLMANHYHLLVETPKGNLSIAMRQLNGMYTRASIAGTNGWATCFKDGTRRFWWRRSPTCWSCVDT
jgi:putative transposase